MKREVVDVLVDILRELRAYSEFHFTAEEKYFDQFNYEGAAEQKHEHEKFRRMIDLLGGKIRKDGTEATFELLDFLEDWFVVHIINLDKQYTKCFNEHGLY